MENSFQTSFIPKKPITSGISRKEPRSLFWVISIFVLIVAIVSSGILFVYKTSLIKKKEISSASLSVARNSFEQETIEELDLFSKRTDIVKQILSNHLVFSPMFVLLGDVTIPSVQYTSFEQDHTNDVFSVKIKGIARDYRSIALQADMFNTVKGRSFKDVVFSDLTKDKSNNITFNLEFNVDPSILSYEKNNLENQTTETPVMNDNTPLETNEVITP